MTLAAAAARNLTLHAMLNAAPMSSRLAAVVKRLRMQRKTLRLRNAAKRIPLPVSPKTLNKRACL